MNYARSIRLLRAALGVSQQELAQMTGLSSSLLSRIEAGERTLSKRNQKVIASSLEIPLNLLDLFALEPNLKRSSQEITGIGKAIIKLSRLAHEKKN